MKIKLGTIEFFLRTLDEGEYSCEQANWLLIEYAPRFTALP